MISVFTPMDRQKKFNALCTIMVFCIAVFTNRLSLAQSFPSSDSASSDDSSSSPGVVSQTASTSEALSTSREGESSATSFAKERSNKAEKVSWPTVVGATSGGLVGISIAFGAGIGVWAAFNQYFWTHRLGHDWVSRLFTPIVSGSAVALGLTVIVAIPAAVLGATICDGLFKPKPADSEFEPVSPGEE